MKILGRDDLLKGDFLQKELVPLENDMAVYVREMTGAEKEVWERSLMKPKPSGDPNKPTEYEVVIDDYKAKLAVCTVCDEDGKLLFKMSDAKVLNTKLRSASIDKISDVAHRLNQISKSEKEEMVKN